MDDVELFTNYEDKYGDYLRHGTFMLVQERLRAGLRKESSSQRLHIHLEVNRFICLVQRMQLESGKS